MQIDYISNIDLDAVHEHEVSLNRVMTSILKDVVDCELLVREPCSTWWNLLDSFGQH